MHHSLIYTSLALTLTRFLPHSGVIHEHEVWESVNDFHWGMRQTDGDSNSNEKNGKNQNNQNNDKNGGKNIIVTPIKLKSTEKAVENISSDSPLKNDMLLSENNGLKTLMKSNIKSDINTKTEMNAFDLMCATLPSPSTPLSSNPTRKEIRSHPTPIFKKLSNENSGICLPNLTHDLNLISAAGFPLYSNYTKHFKDILDYIYIENDKCEILRVAPFPSEAVLSERTALPSKVFPSDHIAVAVDIKFRVSSSS